MSSRPQFSPAAVLTAGDMSGSLLSAVTIIQKLSMVSYSMTWTGTAPVGAISVEVSNDYAKNSAGAVSNAGNWSTLPLSSSTNVSGNSGTGFIDIDASAGYALRVRYTRTSGTGSLTIIVNGKVA